MAQLMATVGAATGLAILAISGIAHLARFGMFRAMLRSHRIWPRSWTTAVALSLASAEIAIVLCGLASLSPGLKDESARVLMSFALVAAALLYAVLAAYGTVLLRRTPGAPCACSSRAEPINVWVPARTAVLAAGCGFAAARTELVLNWTWGTDMFITLLASCTFIALAWTLPRALHDPSGQEPTWTSQPAR